MLKIENLSKTIRGKKILDNISLSVGECELAILLGPSGVGKSTLLRILNNLESFDSGKISLDGKALDISQVHKTHLIGMVFQGFNLFEHLTALENITLALEHVLKQDKKNAISKAQKLLKHYGLLEYAKSYPSQLSGGQKQRLALARTLAIQPKVICLDEPTSALDPLLTNAVADEIKELTSQNFIVIITTHDISLLKKLSGTIYLMKAGTIVESARTQDFSAYPEKFEQINNFVSGRNSNIAQ